MQLAMTAYFSLNKVRDFATSEYHVMKNWERHPQPIIITFMK